MFENSIFKIEFSILLGLFPHHNLYRLTFQSFVIRELDFLMYFQDNAQFTLVLLRIDM